MNIAITGANGFIGRNCVEQLKNHTLIPISRKTINLHDALEVKSFINDLNIDAIVHCAIEGGLRTKSDPIDIVYNNIKIATNLLNAKQYKLFINLASGAEYDRAGSICNIEEEKLLTCSPVDYYGFSKNVISRLVLAHKHGLNLRIFGCFNKDELDSRFLVKNIRNYIMGSNIVIYKNRVMNYIYLPDLISTIQYHLDDCPGSIYKDINAVYDASSSLTEIANIINTCGDHRVEITIETDGFALPYTGNGNKLKNLGIPFVGLEKGIRQCYFDILNEY